MRPLARYLLLISYRAYVLSTYLFDKLYTFEFSPLYTFSFLGNSRFVKFILKYDRFLDDPLFRNRDFRNRFLFVKIEGHRFIHP
jgi:hypothetical protein